MQYIFYSDLVNELQTELSNSIVVIQNLSDENQTAVIYLFCVEFKIYCLAIYLFQVQQVVQLEQRTWPEINRIHCTWFTQSNICSWNWDSEWKQ